MQTNEEKKILLRQLILALMEKPDDTEDDTLLTALTLTMGLTIELSVALEIDKKELTEIYNVTFDHVVKYIEEYENEQS